MARSRFANFSRRRFLMGAGACGMGLPFLSSLVARAGSDPVDRARRLIIFCSPNEPINPDFWLPPGASHGSVLTGLAPEMASLEPYRDKLLMLGNMDMASRIADPHPGGHIGMGHLLVGRRVTEIGPNEPEHWASGMSVDQHIAAALDMDPLTVGIRVSGANGNSRISYVGDSQPVDPVTNPSVLFDNLFADATLPAEELAALKAQRLSVLDRVTGDLERIKSRLPAEGRNKLEIHTDMVRDLELKIESDQVIDCDPTAPPSADTFDYGSNANFPTAVRRQIDVTLQAMGCGISDVATIQLSNSGASNLTPLWPTEGIDLNLNYHDIVHDHNEDPNNATIIDRRLQAETFFYSMFAYLLEQLDTIEEGDGTTMLDNSLVVWMKPIAQRHNFNEFLFMLAGSANGQLSTGRYLSFDGQPHNNLLVNLCNLMGLPDTSYGEAQFCTGPLDLG
ncbi:MAG: DUF1552 domain-containing protein [Deltaproteobacteria bacterium]|nr:DUF1552 domain-containing protein [Deltaproteobacteria bacterium]